MGQQAEWRLENNQAYFVCFRSFPESFALSNVVVFVSPRTFFLSRLCATYFIGLSSLITRDCHCPLLALKPYSYAPFQPSAYHIASSHSLFG